jgi:hypothetical protein
MRRWTREKLEGLAFVGWCSFGELPSIFQTIPIAAGGVYVVYRPNLTAPTFLDRNPGGTWRGDPTVDVTVLEAKWVDEAQVLYIGKANPRQLRRRLRTYHSYGSGGPGRHAGGRYVWQLDDAWDCLVAYRVTRASEVPREIERAMIGALASDYGNLPFGNLVS